MMRKVATFKTREHAEMQKLALEVRGFSTYLDPQTLDLCLMPAQVAPCDQTTLNQLKSHGGGVYESREILDNGKAVVVFWVYDTTPEGKGCLIQQTEEVVDPELYNNLANNCAVRVEGSDSHLIDKLNWCQPPLTCTSTPKGLYLDQTDIDIEALQNFLVTCGLDIALIRDWS